jgi:hypothetical protein
MELQSISDLQCPVVEITLWSSGLWQIVVLWVATYILNKYTFTFIVESEELKSW